MTSKNIYIKNHVSFLRGISLFMPLLLLPFLGDYIKPVLQEKSKVNNP